MINRAQKFQEIQYFFKGLFPIVSILGPRQVGKTTLAKQFQKKAKEETFYFDLERQQDYDRLQDPYLTFDGLEGIVIIDEIQRQPQLFEALRVLVDENKKLKFLILGSASPDIIKGASETLAGRVGFVELSGFNLQESGLKKTNDLWIKGGFPRSFLAKNFKDSFVIREQFIRTFLECDLGLFGLNVDPIVMRRFWTVLAHYHGKTLNFNEIAKTLDIDQRTVKRYVDILEGTYMIRKLTPWINNTKKRLVKSPKIYFRDSGLLHCLLSLENKSNVETHPVCGFSWEGFALEQFISLYASLKRDFYFWSIHNQAEVDLICFEKNEMIGVEFKYSSSPKVEKSMNIAIKELNLNRFFVVYPGDKKYPLSDKITALPLNSFVK